MDENVQVNWGPAVQELESVQKDWEFSAWRESRRATRETEPEEIDRRIARAKAWRTVAEIFESVANTLKLRQLIRHQ